MRAIIRAVVVFAVGTVWLGAQTASVRFNINLPKPATVAATFGTLSKSVSVSEVSVCNDTPSTISISQSRMIQALRAQGYEALSRAASIAVIGTSQVSSKRYRIAKYGQIALNVVSGLVVSRTVSLGPALSATLPSVQGILQVVVPQLQGAISDHAFLSFDITSLPSLVQLAPLECATGTMLLTGIAKDAPAEFGLALPDLTAAGAR